jgi:hypothetical protein
MNGAVGSPEVPRASLGRKILRGLGIFVVLFVILFVAGVIWRMPIVAEQDRSAEVVKQIEKAHLTLADADGSHLPPKLDDIRANATVEGVDANANGIRDDVELAIYAKYPIAVATSSASSTKPVDTNLKLRAAELQYAKALQMYLTSVFTKETLVAAANQAGRGYSCLGDVVESPAIDAPESLWTQYDTRIKNFREEVKALVLNTPSRQDKYEEVFGKYMTSHALSNEQECDLLLNS